MEISVGIDKRAVYDEVIKITGYAAYKGSTGDEAADSITYERIAANELNDELFDRYFNEATSDVLKEARMYLKTQPAYEKEGKKGLYVTLSMPTAWDDSHKDGINTMIQNYYIDHIVSKWMRLTKHEEEKKYTEDSVVELSNIRYELNHRKSLGRSFFGLS